MYGSKGSSRTRCFFYRLEKVRETAQLERISAVVEGSLPAGAELVEARFSGGPLLTLLVDREDGPVDHEFTSKVASAISPALDAEGYDGMVEVSSPGIERPLTRPDHFRRFVGSEAKVKLAEPFDGRKNFTGVIESAGEETFKLQFSVGEKGVELPYGSVVRAHLKEDI